MKQEKSDEITAKTKSKEAQGLRTLFTDQLKDIYWAEKKLMDAIPKMRDNSTSQQLAEALSEHLSVTEKQVERLEKVFSVIDTAPQAIKCEAMAGLVKEGEEIMQESEKGMVRDAGIIAAAQKIEHYEIATYGTLRTHAQILNQKEAVSLLNETLDEEKEADKKLTEIASLINIEAAEETEEVKAK